MDVKAAALSFTALEKRIAEMPEGPAFVLTTPRLLRWLNTLGTVAFVTASLPFLLVKLLEPQMWMVRMAEWGTWSAAALYAPGFVRSAIVLLREFWRWRSKLVAQGDHDLEQFLLLRQWLQTFPRAAIEEHRNFARLSRDRIGAKLSLLTGGIERVGLLPVLIAVFFLLKEVEGIGIDSLRDMPFWQAVLGPFLVVTWLIGVIAVRMRLQYDLYDMVLSDALQHQCQPSVSK